MLQLDLLRYVKDSEVPTLGRLYGPGLEEIETLENPWANNEPNISCIPAGWYTVRVGNFRGRYPDLEVTNPPAGRSAIEVHAGNRVEDTRGCILVGLDRIWNEDGPELRKSREALTKLVSRVESEGNTATLVVAYR